VGKDVMEVEECVVLGVHDGRCNVCVKEEGGECLWRYRADEVKVSKSVNERIM